MKWKYVAVIVAFFARFREGLQAGDRSVSTIALMISAFVALGICLALASASHPEKEGK